MLADNSLCQGATVLVAGCGFVGTAVGVELARHGATVLALRRNTAQLPPTLHRFPGDLLNPSGWRHHLPPRVDYVLYCAGADGSDEAAYQRAYVVGLERTLSALPAGVRRFFFTSSTSVYAQEHGEWVDEESRTEPSQFSGRCMLQAEAILASAGVPHTVLRCSGIYGPGRTRLVDMVRTGRMHLPPRAHYTNRIHRDDIAGALVHVIGVQEAPTCLLLNDDEPASQQEVATFLAQTLGVPVPPVDPTLQTAPGKRCNNARLRSLGYSLRFPTFREGYAAMLHDMTAPRCP